MDFVYSQWEEATCSKWDVQEAGWVLENKTQKDLSCWILLNVFSDLSWQLWIPWDTLTQFPLPLAGYETDNFINWRRYQIMTQSIPWDTWDNTWDSLWYLGTVFCYYIVMQQNFSPCDSQQIRFSSSSWSSFFHVEIWEEIDLYVYYSDRELRYFLHIFLTFLKNSPHS